MHDVKGSDKVGAKMDSMDLEREKGITIQSAATHCIWQTQTFESDPFHFNIIDTPGHVDFTIEVERALRVLDGAVLLVCASSGVQAQTFTVTKQMNRYNLPRVCFINKLDRLGANPLKIADDIKNKLSINVVVMQIPVGLEDNHKGVIDLLTQEMQIFKGDGLEYERTKEFPEQFADLAKEYRQRLFENMAEIDEEIEEYFLNEEFPPLDVMHAAIRRQTIGLKIVPLFMGAAYKNKGVQPVLDAVCRYLPSPSERKSVGYVMDENEVENEVELKTSDLTAPFVGLAFKLETNKFGQLTYVKTYQGQLKKGDTVVAGNKKYKMSRLIKMHSNEMEDIEAIYPGDIFCTFGVPCNTGDTITDGSSKIRMNKMYVPPPVMSMSIRHKDKDRKNFAKAMEKFTREDPTFSCDLDEETGETIIKGMGELHLEIYSERLKREFNVENELGEPQVNYRESIGVKAEFNYLHKKQTGGSGQYGKVIGYIEPIESGDLELDFEDKTIGNNLSKEYIPAIEKGYLDICERGPQTGYPVIKVRFVLLDGDQHSVDSSSNAFMAAAKGAFRQAYENAQPVILQPHMNIDVNTPSEFQSQVIGGLVKRKASISDVRILGDITNVSATAPLANMFGYSTELRGSTQGQADFSMEFENHQPLMENERMELLEKFKDQFNRKKSKEI